MWDKGWRDRVWAELDRPWDLIVIGGGITGAGILREAVRNGLRALLLEGADFASGTSSRSSKLVHGGLRYLRNGQIKTTIASVHERERLLRDGIGLINPLGFLYASYAADKVPLWAMGFGLTVYDVLGLRWGHKRYAPQTLTRLAPSLNQVGLQGGYRYYDANTDDARLVLRVIREAVHDGGLALNYAWVEKLLTKQDGRVCGLAVRDVSGEAGDRAIELQATIVVNAGGAAADRLRQQVGGAPRLRLLRGSHLIFPMDKLPLEGAVCFVHPADGRPVFAIPWEGVTLFGTTDVDHGTVGVENPVISAQEVDYLLSALSHGFPVLELTEADVLATLSGIRAVVDTGKTNPSKESREHVIWPENGLLTVSGGKLTTFRVMALDALRAVRSQFAQKPRFQSNQVLDAPADLSALVELEPIQRLRLAGRYGLEALQLIDAARPGELSPIDNRLNQRLLWAELRWTARAEGVVHLDDLMLRRVRLGLLFPDGGIPWLEQIRTIAQPELGWDDERWEKEAAVYSRLWHAQYGCLDAHSEVVGKEGDSGSDREPTGRSF